MLVELSRPPFLNAICHELRKNLSLVTRILQENAATISPGGEASGSWRGETVAGIVGNNKQILVPKSIKMSQT
jgi:hypothetical protein